MLSKKCLRILCLVYVLIFISTGLFLIGFSSVLLYRLQWYNSLIISEIYWPIISLFFVGIGIVALSWLGWKGCNHQHRPHIILFCAFIIVLIGLELFITIWDTIILNRFPEETKSLMQFSFVYYKNSTLNSKTNSYTKIWNRIQSELLCCGINGPVEYMISDSSTAHFTVIPTSCCFIPKESQNNATACSILYQRGCLQPFEEYISTQILFGLFSGLIIAFIQFFGIFCTYSYSKSLLIVPRRSIESQTNALNRQSSIVTTQNVATTTNATPEQIPLATSPTK